MSLNLDVPPKKLAVWCDYDYCSPWDSEFCIFTASVGRISHCRWDSFFSTLTVIPSLFSRVFFSFFCLCACKLHVVQGHVIDTTHGSKHCQVVCDYLSLFISWDLLLEVSKGVKMDAVDKDKLPWLAMWQCAMSIYEKIQNDSNSSLVPDLYIDLIFSIFMTRALFQLIYYFVCLVLLFLTISQMLDLREKLGVTIQHLIGPNNEQLLLGCCDSTKVHPKVIKSQDGILLHNMQDSILAERFFFAGASVSFDVLF